MIKLIKNPLPQGINIKSREDWSNSSPVREQLERECYSKCYICEDKSSNLTVDHIKPQNSYPDLTYNWDNLLLACEHCNGVKGSRYANIINPVECDPESEILFAGMQLNRVNISANISTQEATDTVNLLNAVYNGDTVDAGRKLGCSKLLGKLRVELVQFELYIKNHDNVGYADMIRESIDRKSPFSAFKRKIIRDNPQLSVTFAEALNNN